MAHDLVIRGGTVIDGTGAPGVRADVAVDGDRVSVVGEVDAGRAGRVIDAGGRLVTPGFVDLHSHLDAQVGWDALLTSSCWHGVTSVLLGNCGMTFAPVRAEDHGTLAELMESVEDIPAASILAGLPWDWETYGEFLASLERLPKGLNTAGLVGHSALRYYVMGERSLDPDADPTAEELDALCGLVDEAMAAGAAGFSTSRTLRHRAPDGRYVPGTFAGADELLAIADVLARHGRGVFECAPRFDGEGDPIEKVRDELSWMTAVAARSGRPLTFNLTNTAEQGEHYRVALELAAAAAADGATIRPQTTPRGIGVLFCLSSMTPFDGRPAWQELKGHDLGGKLAALSDPAVRARLIADGEADGGPRGLDRMYVLHPDTGARYDCRPEDALTAVAAARGVSPAEAWVDLCLETGGRVVLSWPILNQDLDRIGEMLQAPGIIMGLADAGAHVGQIMDASQPTSFLLYWVRERGLFGIEEGIRRLTSDTAAFAGFADRGVLRPGAFADLNVIDWDGLALPVPEFVHDLPGGAGRFVQGARGYDATVVNGEVFMEHGEHTGALAGRVLRG